MKDVKVMNRMTKGDKTLEIVFYIVISIMIILCAYPIWYSFMIA